ncbi:MAG: Fic family protein [Cardiobacteriaceae bacterium]|nr:Fic family protein [Cardiobacteriaceae bacterium]
MNLEIFDNADYVADLTVRMAHHSTAIEGNTLSQDETATIILNRIIPRKGLNEREFYEVVNYRRIIPFMLENLHNSRKIDNEFIKEIHAILLDKLIYNQGKFKTTQNMIVGANFDTTPPYQVPYVLKDSLDNLEYRLKQDCDDDEKLLAILEFHLRFEKIHPFSDGNGRVGRFIMFYQVLENNLMPFIITTELKDKYIFSLRENNVKELIKIVKELQFFEQERINKFN